MKISEEKKKRVFDIIQIGHTGDFVSILFDVLLTGAILCNLFIAIFDTFEASAPYKGLLNVLEWITVLGFTVEYALRVWTARYLYPRQTQGRARLKYIFSFGGLIDLLSFLPFYLPLYFPAGIVAFRTLRIMRILRLFQLDRYYDAFNVIADVLKRKRDQIFSSMMILLMLMMASSLCMYGLEHDAQPDVFQNAFSGFWWSASTLLTVGYGDIYPITVPGKILGIFITFLGVGMVAIPTGILSAGFVEQYGARKEAVQYMVEEELRFVQLQIGEEHPWAGKSVRSLTLPPGMILAVIRREDGTTLIPRGNMVVEKGDSLVIGAESTDGDIGITLKELTLRAKHPWVGCRVRDLDISRNTLIVMVHHEGRTVIPNGNTVLHEGDEVFLYTKKNIPDADEILI